MSAWQSAGMPGSSLPLLGYSHNANKPSACVSASPSAGCVHSHPEHVERIYKALVRLGVTVNDNPFSGQVCECVCCVSRVSLARCLVRAFMVL